MSEDSNKAKMTGLLSPLEGESEKHYISRCASEFVRAHPDATSLQFDTKYQLPLRAVYDFVVSPYLLEKEREQKKGLNHESRVDNLQEGRRRASK